MTAIEFQFKLINLHEHLMKYAYSLTADKEDAKDLVQDTILKALKYSDKFEDESNFKGWTYTILKNTFINGYRRSAWENAFREQSKAAFSNYQIRSNGYDDPESTFSALEINQNIDQLKEIFRIPLKMHINGYKYKEIADTLNLNIGTVKSRIFLSRKQLKDQLCR